MSACSSETWPLTPLPDDEGHPFLLLADWAPRGHSLVMVHNYDIYYRPGPRSSSGYRVTNTAVPGVVSHGVPDWLYEGSCISLSNVICCTGNIEFSWVSIFSYFFHKITPSLNIRTLFNQSFVITQFFN